MEMKYVRTAAMAKTSKARQDRKGTDQLKVLKIQIRTRWSVTIHKLRTFKKQALQCYLLNRTIYILRTLEIVKYI